MDLLAYRRLTMKRSEFQKATKKLTQLQTEYHIDILTDWGYENPNESGAWGQGTWSVSELDKLHNALNILVHAMGGADRFIQNLGGVTVKKSNIGSHGGEALAHRVSLSIKGTFSAWTIAHEMAHAWDANHKWKLSVALERYTGGFTNRILSKIKKFFGRWDAGLQGEEDKPGRHGRLHGCNAAGYFYGDKPSGSNWDFNRKEDFAESVAMYLGWQRNNDLSTWAEARIKRYLLENSASDKNFGVENWADYAKYFYPQDGDYTKTKRWKFVDKLMHGRIEV